MRAVYNNYGKFTKDHSKLSVFNALCPEVKQVELFFAKPNMYSMLNGNLVEKMEIEFDNGKLLEINGVFLHKFLDTPPVSVSDDNEQYIAYNPYTTTGTTKELITKIRQGFTYLLEKEDFSLELERYKSIKVEYLDDGSFNVSTIRYKELSKDTQTKLADRLSNGLGSGLDFFDDQLIDFLESAFLKPRIVQDFVREGDGLRNSFTEVEWGDISHLLFKDFLTEYDATRDGVPYYTSYMDRLRSFSRSHLTTKLRYVLEEMVKKDTDTLGELVEFLGFPETIEEVVDGIMGDDEILASGVLFEYWYAKHRDQSIGSILAQKK